MAITYDRNEVIWRMSAIDAHDFGVYLFVVGTRDNDEVSKDGETLITMAHRAMSENEWEVHVQQGCAWEDKRW